MSPEIEEIIYLALENGIISRGKACLALKIDRCDLDDWIASFEEELNCGLWNGGKTVKAYETNTGTMGGE